MMRISPVDRYFSKLRSSCHEGGKKDDLRESLLHAINRFDEKKFNALFTGLERRSRKSLFLEVYDRFVGKFRAECEKTSRDCPSFRKKFKFLLTQAYTFAPDLGRYIVLRDIYEEETQLHKKRTSPIFTPEGIRFVIDCLRNKGSLLLPCEVYDDYESLENVLYDMSRVENETERRLCIVRTRSLAARWSDDVHVIPLYIERRVGSPYIFFVPDSADDEHCLVPLKGMIRSMFKSACIFTAALPRQYDRTNCPLFSIRDVVVISRNSTIITDLMKTNPNIKNSETNCGVKSYPCILPPEMQKTAQRMNKVYNIDWSLEKHIIIDSHGKRSNILIQERFYKYMRLILDEVL